ncbi:ABC transporter permease [Arenibacter sp. GZD96]|uniref:ABC transporter permease n=1 Tax=Aurantibrevibacter litoralis TaxID=3106030 RepID=UPI002AFEA04A|nr:ABC transporter permease [Arenibacter sp. GZD-96]MEA1786516.1 ABC transporter permease [Arenibacter sp. GZD-96]
MLKNNLKIACRSLWKNKGYSALNIFGLAIGITCAGLIFLWVEDEVNFDSAFPKQDLVYFVPTNQKYEGEWRTFYSTPGPLAKDLKDEIPEITRTATTWSGEILITEGDKGINRRGRYAEPDFLEIFSLRFVEGSAKNALNRPDAIVLTQRTATALFGKNTNALNRVLRIDNTYNFTVTGVVADLPNNVSFGFDWLLPFERFQLGEEDVSWAKEYGNNFADTFVELAPDADFKAVDAKVQKIIPAKTEDPNTYAFLHSIKDWHLRSEFKGGKIVGGQITFVRLFSIIALIILLIACINFMNLSTARSEKRAKEVGIRKVLGSGKNRLISQFIAEALITASLATMVSVVLLLILLPQFNILAEKQLELRLFDPIHVFALIGITLICGLLAGWYPAFYLSSFKPVKVIKGVQVRENSATYIRKGLVVAQFAVSIVFIISTIIVYQQVQHVKSRDLGYQKENLIKINVNGDMIKNFNPIRQDMIASGLIENLALNNSDILYGGNNGSGFEWQGGTDTKEVLISFRHISPSFLETAGMKIIDGRGFSENQAPDSTSVMVSQSLAKMMGDGSAVGKTITRGETYTIIGVVQDYLYGDMYGTSDPVLFFNNPDAANYMYVKIKLGNDLSEALAFTESVMKKHNPAFPFEYEFVDDAFNAMFRSEKLVGNLSKIFALLAIIISCLGLFGLSAYTAEQRRKEIGIRKVLGSNVSGIVRLLSKDFMGLVLVAILLAIPLAWWAMQNWLERFAYRIDIPWWVFPIAGVIAIVIALITVSFQSIRVALLNPVKSLRTE